MSNYEQNTVKERIRDATDIVELVGKYVPLKREGRNFAGRCPWHDDKNPSLKVDPTRQTFKCWVCDIGGDVFTFIMKIENVDFRGALEILSDKTGIPLPKFRGGGGEEKTTEGEQEIKRNDLFRAAAWVAKIYHETLLYSDEALPARDYLEKRNVGTDEIKKFNLGYAPIDRHWLAGKVQNKPHRIKMLEIIGNFREERKDDFFRGRLIFPIRDDQGRTVAFGGRVIPGSPLSEDAWHKDRKYLNSPETSLFSKHKVLYGLDLAKKQFKETRRTLIMEGYTDCITAHQFGFGEAVAVLGTALGPAHIRLLNRMDAGKIIVILDGDSAGQKAAERDQVLKDFIAEGADMAVLTLPEGHDPSDFLITHGADALHALLETETVDALEHVFRAKTRGINLQKDYNGSIKALDAILEIVAHAPLKGTSPNDPIRFRIEKTLQSLSMKFGQPDELIRRRLKEQQQRIAHRPARTDDTETPPTAIASLGSPDELPDMTEREMLELWIMDPTAIYEFWERVLPDQLRSPVTLAIYNQCSELVEQRGRPATFENLMTAFDDPKMKNFLVELETSARKKFFSDDDNDMGSALLDELTERWKEPAFAELKAKLIEEIIAEFDRRENDRKRQREVNRLRDPELSDDEKMKQLLELQQKLGR